MAAKFEVFEDKEGRWRWRLKARNGEVVAASESYDSKDNALRGVKDAHAAAAAAGNRSKVIYAQA